MRAPAKSLAPSPTRAYRIRGKAADRYILGSSSAPGETRTVTHDHGQDSWSCSCAGFRYRKTCSHVRRIRASVAA